LRQVVDGQVEIGPSGPRKAGTDLIVQPNLAVSFERSLHRRPQHIVAFFVRHPASRDDPHDIVGQLLDDFDHEAPLFNFVFSVPAGGAGGPRE